MGDTIQIKGGVKSGLPTLLPRELGYCTDTQELYIGTSEGNVCLGKVAWATDISSLNTSVERIDDDIGAMDITVEDHARRIATLETQVAGLLNTEGGG